MWRNDKKWFPHYFPPNPPLKGWHPCAEKSCLSPSSAHQCYPVHQTTYLNLLKPVHSITNSVPNFDSLLDHSCSLQNEDHPFELTFWLKPACKFWKCPSCSSTCGWLLATSQMRLHRIRFIHVKGVLPKLFHLGYTFMNLIPHLVHGLTWAMVVILLRVMKAFFILWHQALFSIWVIKPTLTRNQIWTQWSWFPSFFFFFFLPQ